VTTTTPKWHKRAVCAGADDADEIFFPVSVVMNKLGGTHARQFCDICPVMFECLKSALDNNETDGIWGGMTPGERLDLKSKVRSLRSLTIEQLQDVVEVELPACAECGKHRKEKGDGLCATCFYAARRSENPKPKKTCSAPECPADVHAKGKCSRHYHQELRERQDKVNAERKTTARKEMVDA